MSDLTRTALPLALACMLVGCVSPQASHDSNLERVRREARAKATAFADQWAVNGYNFVGYTLFEKVQVPPDAKVTEQEGLRCISFIDPASTFRKKRLDLDKEGNLLGIFAASEFRSWEEARDHFRATSEGLRARFPNLVCDRPDICQVSFVPRDEFIEEWVSSAESTAKYPYLKERNARLPDSRLKYINCVLIQNNGAWISTLTVHTVERNRIAEAYKARQSTAIQDELNKGPVQPR